MKKILRSLLVVIMIILMGIMLLVSCRTGSGVRVYDKIDKSQIISSPLKNIGGYYVWLFWGNGNRHIS
jgi:uncharacterized protein YxeA